MAEYDTVRRRSPWGRLLTFIVVIWLLIGVAAAYQRHYFGNGNKATCSTVSTVVVTIVAGPLNYVGVNPKVHCTTPQPSK